MRPVRPRVVVAGLLLAGLALVTAVGWHQSDFLRESTANYLRERLAAEFGAQFLTSELRGRWLPPGISLGHVTFERSGEPWVLTAEDVRVSFNPYAIVFGRERLGRVVVDRPRLFVRSSIGRAPGAPSATPESTPESTPETNPTPSDAGVVRAGLDRLRAFLRPPFPLRVLEIVDGRIDVIDASGARSVADGIDLSVLVSRGAARVALEAGSLAIERAGRRSELGGLDADLTLEEGQAVVRELALSGGPVTGSLRGRVAYAGTLALAGDLAARLDAVAALAGRPGVVAGTAQFAGEIAGSWRNPAATGTLSVKEPVVAGSRLPPARGQVGWSGGRLSWSQLRLPVGEGALTVSGEARFAGGTPRYRFDAEARDVDPALLKAVPAGIGGQVGPVTGTLHWEGSGIGREAAGGGGFDARFALQSWPGDPLALQADAALEHGVLALGSFRAATRTLEATGSGSWSAGAGLAVNVSGTVGDVQQLLPPGKVVALAGSGSFDGEFGVDANGPRFAGAARVAKVSYGPIGGIEAGARVAVAAGGVRLDNGVLAWPGGSGSFGGTAEIATRRLDLTVDLGQLALADVARVLGADPRLFAGSLAARLRVRGTADAPEVAGEASGQTLRYRALTLDAAALSLTYAGRRLGVSRLQVSRGTTQLAFRGEVRDGTEIEGAFESAAFDLADVTAVPGVEFAGSLSGRVRGRLDAPQVEGTVRAGRLRYAGFDLKGGELAVDYRGGTAGVKGWIGAAENRLRVVVEPSRDWRFESDLELAQFAPEMVRSGLGALPPAVAKVLGRASFLAAGRLKARGRLQDASSVVADLWLDSLWLQTSGQSLQNLAPVRVSWRNGGLAVEDFRIAGEQYHFEVRGGGSPAAGWDLKASGAVNLSLFQEYWAELEDVGGMGDLKLTVGGPWAAPRPEGSLVVRDAVVRVRSLPEALEQLGGRLELHGGTLTAVGLSGTLGGGAFRGEGRYRFGDDHLDAQVEGRLDLALFRGRLPAARELRGPLDVHLRLVGPLAAPAVSGEVEVLDAEMFLRPFPAKFTHLRGKIVVGADRLEVRGVEGQTGGGTARLTGTLEWARSPVRVDAELEGRGIQISLAGDLKLQSDLRLRLQGDFQDLKLSGEVRVLKARYLREFDEPAPKLQTGAAAAPAAGGANLSRMALDVKVVASDNVWIANRMAKIEAAVALAIGGRLGAPVISGEITGIQGEAYYLSRKFRLESGSLRFVPPTAVPLLDLQASTSVGETQILFLMDGPLGKLSYHLTSLPAMSQQDLIALLTIGETRSDLERRGDRASTAGAAAFTAEPLVNALGDEARSAMGLDVLQLEPVIGENQQVSARVTLGTHLSDRLFVSYSQTLGATEDQQVAVQYSLLDYLSVWGQELRQGIYSLDLVFRYALK